MAPSSSSQKTSPTDVAVADLLAASPTPRRRADAERLSSLLREWTGEPPVLWGSSIVGFGTYRYRYESRHEGTSALVGFSPRKAALVVYLVGGVAELYPELVERLGPHKRGKGCLYLRRLDDVDAGVLRQLVDAARATRRPALTAQRRSWNF